MAAGGRKAKCRSRHVLLAALVAGGHLSSAGGTGKGGGVASGGRGGGVLRSGRTAVGRRRGAVAGSTAASASARASREVSASGVLPGRTLWTSLKTASKEPASGFPASDRGRAPCCGPLAWTGEVSAAERSMPFMRPLLPARSAGWTSGWSTVPRRRGSGWSCRERGHRLLCRCPGRWRCGPRRS